MVKVKIMYRGESVNLWDLPEMGAQDSQHVSYYEEKVIFEDKVRKGRLVTLCEALTDVETFCY